MLARVLFISDLHKSDRDMSTIKGRVEVQRMIQRDIIEFNKRNGVTHNIIGGDWYHRGFHSTGAAYSAFEEDRELAASVNGNVYLCLGNHFFLERDDNPEMYIIQPNALYKPKDSISSPEKPIFNVVNELLIGKVQFSFFHFNKLNKDYHNTLKPGAEHHIGIYHDDNVVPTWVREKEGYAAKATSSAYMSQIFDNVELGLFGHIHTKIGLVKYALNDGREIPLFIPGALGITANSDRYKHTEVQLPIIDIFEDGHYEVKLASFSTHIDKLRFYENKSRKKDLTTDQVMLNNSDAFKGVNTNLTLSAYMKNCGHSDLVLRFLDQAKVGCLDLPKVMNTVAEFVRNGGNNDGCETASDDASE